MVCSYCGVESTVDGPKGHCNCVLQVELFSCYWAYISICISLDLPAALSTMQHGLTPDSLFARQDSQFTPYWSTSQKLPRDFHLLQENQFSQFALIKGFLILIASSNACPSWAVTGQSCGHFSHYRVPPAASSHCWLLCSVSSSFLGNWIRQYCPQTRISPMLVLPGKVHFSGQWDSTLGTVPAWCPVLPTTQCPSPKQPTHDFFKTALFPSCYHSISSVDIVPPAYLFLHKCFFRYLVIFYGLLLPFLLH